MFSALITFAATTALGALSEGVCVGLAAASIARGAQKVGLSFKK